MPVLVVCDRTTGNTAACRMNEGPGVDALTTFGSAGPAVNANLAWIRDVVAPALGAVVRDEPIPLVPLMVAALADGDELHGRLQAAGGLFRTAALDRVSAGGGRGLKVEELLTYLETATFHFLRIAMAGCESYFSVW